jgi:hypothetical protein
MPRRSTVGPPEGAHAAGRYLAIPVDIHGRSYATVAERLAAAHNHTFPVGIQRIETEFLAFGVNPLCRATVTVDDGRVFTGHAEVPIDSKNPAERDAPHECAETSAVGRALAMAGYPGSESGMAGAEEIQRPPRRNAPQAPRIPPEIEDDTRRIAPQHEQAAERLQHGSGITEPQKKLIRILSNKLKLPLPGDLDEYTMREASDLITELKEEAGE